MKQPGRKAVAALAVVKPEAPRLAPPPLPEAAMRHWLAIVNGAPAERWRPEDAPLLAAFCVQSAVVESACAALVEGDNDAAAFDALSRASAELCRLGTKLRLVPSTRTRPDAAMLAEPPRPGCKPLHEDF